MSSLGFIDQYLKNANRFYAIAANQFDLYLKLMGTDCTIHRIKDESPYKNVFGTTYSSTLIDDDDVQRFKYRVLINMNDMYKIYQKSIESMELMDNQNVMKLGDVIVFNIEPKEYRFKIIDEQAFGGSSEVIYKYTISGFQEILGL